jgi:CDP-glucose 4,6-dehydratase
VRDASAWRGRSVLVTGHTGFKGSWLSLWLHQLGAQVHGYAIDPPTRPSLFEEARVASVLASHTHADIADVERLRAVVRASRAEVIFHLAAQSLVRVGYAEPLRTWADNVMGTANVLEAARASDLVRAVIVITTDKVYENHGEGRPYRETDPLGGHDPYSASKAAAEILSASYRASFFKGSATRIATVRAGNVIGGGDWAAERLIPDCFRAFAGGRAVELRYPDAVRPWQHVLEPVEGYLTLAQQLLESRNECLDSAFNFGPDQGGDATVGAVARAVAELWGDAAQVVHSPSAANPPEQAVLRLDSARARSELGWRPRWSLRKALEQTVAWHRAWLQGADMQELSRAQIFSYQAERQ